MAFCEYCERLPAKLFSSNRMSQCTLEHHKSVAALRVSASDGCSLCRLFIEAAKAYKGEYAQEVAWAEEDIVRISSSKFGKQIVRFGNYQEAGLFRGYEMPKEWGVLPNCLEHHV
jgi:hypothetical protein